MNAAKEVFSMEKHEKKMDVYRDLAARFAKLGEFFSELGSPEAAGALIESLVVGDSREFNAFVDRLDLPMSGKCYWLKEVVEHVICSPTTYDVYVPRKGLTRLELRQYLAIVQRHSANGEILFYSDGSIVPGPFLQELQAAGLVDHTYKRGTTCALEPVLSAPEQVCL
jgi:hypothetical protein